MTLKTVIFSKFNVLNAMIKVKIKKHRFKIRKLSHNSEKSLIYNLMILSNYIVIVWATLKINMKSFKRRKI